MRTRFISCLLVAALVPGLLPRSAFAAETGSLVAVQESVEPEPALAPAKEPAAKEPAPEKAVVREPVPEKPVPVPEAPPAKDPADQAQGKEGSKGSDPIDMADPIEAADPGNGHEKDPDGTPAGKAGFADPVASAVFSPGLQEPVTAAPDPALRSDEASEAAQALQDDDGSLPVGVVFAAGGLLYRVLGPGKVEASGWVSAAAVSGSLVLPSTVNDLAGNTYTVVAVAQNAFENSAALTSVTFPGTVTTIANRAFAGCGRLTQVSLPGSLTTLGNHAFAGTGLTGITLPGSLIVIGNQAFANTSLRSITLPGSLQEIGNQAFLNGRLSRVSIPVSVTRIGIDAFYGNPLQQVVFEGKRVAHVFPETAQVFFTVTFRTERGSVVAVRAVLDGTPVTAEIVRAPEVPPVEGMNGYWQAEEGFSLFEPVTGSFSVVAVYTTEAIIDIGGATVSPIAPQPYTAYEVRPPVVVAYGDRVLREGTDYALSYSNNIEPGSNATVTVWGQGTFKGKVTIRFSIYRDPSLVIDIAGARIDPIRDQGFLGHPVEPAPVVRLGATVLTVGRDYIVSYEDNYWVGTATVTIEGINRYSGTITTAFEITARANTPGDQINLATLDAIIALAEAVDPTSYTSHSVSVMNVFLDGARALRVRAVAERWVWLDQHQDLIDDAARLLYMSYMNLEARIGEFVMVVVWAPDAVLYTAPFGLPIRPLAPGEVFFAQLDYEVADAFWYVVKGVGYMRATDVFAHPVEGVGDPYDVVCMAQSVVSRAYPFDWAQATGTYEKQTVLTVRTVSDEWLRVIALPAGGSGNPAAPGTPVAYSYIRARDVRPIDGSFPPPGSPGNPLPPGGGDPNKADPNEHNPEERSPEIPGHGIGGTGGDPRGLLPVDWWPASNSTGISRFARFWVKFPNNISDPGDSAVNVTRVALYRADGTRVPTRNYTLSRNLYPDSRRYIYIQPTQPLDWGTRYYIEVLPGFQARNGMVSTVTLTIPFSTELYPYARGEGSAPPPTLAPSGNGIGFWADPGPGDPDPPVDPDPGPPVDPDPNPPVDPDPGPGPKDRDGKVFGGIGGKGFGGSGKSGLPGDGGPPDGHGPAPGPGYSVAGTALGTMANALTRTARDNPSAFSGLVPAINTPRVPRPFSPAPQVGSGAAAARLDGTEGGDTMPPAASGTLLGIALMVAMGIARVFYLRRRHED